MQNAGYGIRFNFQIVGHIQNIFEISNLFHQRVLKMWKKHGYEKQNGQRSWRPAWNVHIPINTFFLFILDECHNS